MNRTAFRSAVKNYSINSGEWILRDDILKLVAGQKSLTHIFIATFNIDFIFIESVLLRELRKCGHPSLDDFRRC